MNSNISNDKIVKLIIETVESFALDNKIEVKLPCSLETRLFGGNSAFDSMALVSLIVQIEEEIEEKFGKSLILADEKAMSRRTSPFSNISSLSDYITEILNNE
jgi:acyl carrier protein